MAVIVGIVFGALAGFRGWAVSPLRLVAVPGAVAVIEIVVNAIRFGVAAMIVWSVVLLSLVVLGTVGSRALATRAAARRRD